VPGLANLLKQRHRVAQGSRLGKILAAGLAGFQVTIARRKLAHRERSIPVLLQLGWTEMSLIHGVTRFPVRPSGRDSGPFTAEGRSVGTGITWRPPFFGLRASGRAPLPGGF